MESGSGSDAREPAKPAAAAPAAAEPEEEIDDRVKIRRLQCMGFALMAKCETTMAHTFLSENDWQMDVGLRFSFSPLFPVGGACPPSLCLCFSESAERLLRTAREQPLLATPASDVLPIRGLVSDGGRGLFSGGSVGHHKILPGNGSRRPRAGHQREGFSPRSLPT